MEVPVTKIEYVDRLQVREDVPPCNIPYAKNLTIEEILRLAQRQHTALVKCNAVIDVYNKTK